MSEEQEQQNQEENENENEIDDREILSLEEERAFESYKKDVEEAYKQNPSVNDIISFRKYLEEKGYPNGMITTAVELKYVVKIICPICKCPIELEQLHTMTIDFAFQSQCKCGANWVLQEIEE
jgi:hypothetical protein